MRTLQDITSEKPKGRPGENQRKLQLKEN